MKITIKIIPVSFYKYCLKIRVINRDESDVFECHFINTENHDFVNSYETDYFIVKTTGLKFFRTGKLTDEERESIWNQINDVYIETKGQEFIID